MNEVVWRLSEQDAPVLAAVLEDMSEALEGYYAEHEYERILRWAAELRSLIARGEP